MASKDMSASFSLRSQLWFRWTGRCFETATSHMQAVGCKLKKMTTDEIKTLAKKKKQEGDIDEALNLFKQLWELEKNEWNGYFLAQCLRKSDNYTEARELHNELEKVYPNFKPLQNDKLWLDYSEKIKDWQNPNLIKDAEDILSRADKYDQYTSSVYTKTVLNVVKHLCYE